MKENFLNKKKIYFHIDELSRDSITASAFNKVLKEYGAKIIYGNRRTSSLLLPHFYYLFDLIILPRPIFVKELIGKKNLPPVVIIFTEGASRYVLENDDIYTLTCFLGHEFMNGDTKYVDNLTKIFLWGNAAKSRIIKYFPNLKDKVEVIGNPRMDQLCVSENNRKNKKNIGFITRFSMLNDYLDRKPIDKLVKYSLNTDSFNNKIEINNKEKNFYLDERNTPTEVLYSEAADISTIVELIRVFKAKEYNVFLKVHPRENKNFWNKIFRDSNLNIEVANWLIPFSEWSSNMDYIIGPASTTFYDCIRNKTTPICMRYLFPKREFHVEKAWEEHGSLMEDVFHPKSINELIEFIEKNKKLIPNKKILEKMQHETNYPNSSNQITLYVIEFNKILKKNKNIPRSILLYELSLIFVNFVSKLKKFINRNDIQGSDYYIDSRTKNHIDNLVK